MFIPGNAHDSVEATGETDVRLAYVLAADAPDATSVITRGLWTS